MKENNSRWCLEDMDFKEILSAVRMGSNERRTNVHYDKNQFVYVQEEPARHVYIIAEGRVKIGSYTDDGKENIKAILSKDEIFGELAIAGENHRSDFAQAMDNNTKVWQLTIDEMHELMQENREISFKIFKLIGMRLRRLEKKIEGLVFKDARSRIIDFLRDTAAWRGKKVGFETMIPTKFTHKEIAGLTGTSRQTVTTILNELREKNLINFDRRKILIRDLEKLR